MSTDPTQNCGLQSAHGVHHINADTCIRITCHYLLATRKNNEMIVFSLPASFYKIRVFRFGDIFKFSHTQFYLYCLKLSIDFLSTLVSVFPQTTYYIILNIFYLQQSSVPYIFHLLLFFWHLFLLVHGAVVRSAQVFCIILHINIVASPSYW